MVLNIIMCVHIIIHMDIHTYIRTYIRIFTCMYASLCLSPSPSVSEPKRVERDIQCFSFLHNLIGKWMTTVIWKWVLRRMI